MTETMNVTPTTEPPITPEEPRLPRVPALELRRARRLATTYEFVVPTPLGGYALCTVNDGTGELLITSDWGHWAYQWSPRPSHLGAATLTAFIARREAADYIADKLQGRRGSRQFSAELTAKTLCHLIAKRRLGDGREARERTGLEIEMRAARRGGNPLLAGKARALVDEIDEIACDLGTYVNGGDLFLERLCRVLDQHRAHHVIEEPWEHLEYEQTYADRVLRESIIPALIVACKVTQRDRLLVAANGPQPSPDDEAYP